MIGSRGLEQLEALVGESGDDPAAIMGGGLPHDQPLGLHAVDGMCESRAGLVGSLGQLRHADGVTR
ncbi:hypothetical protein SDC9_120580 [bioreactor metagenome]|uniref:Uncharacterized protein n=1 Tax=bioreactor metagenome TaxID=1076179 RepID=A0A645C7Z8_9ZZZZ